MPKTQKKFDAKHNPLVVLLRILANALLEDEHGINITACNALLLLAAAVDKATAEEIEKKTVVTEDDSRCRYEN